MRSVCIIGINLIFLPHWPLHDVDSLNCVQPLSETFSREDFLASISICKDRK